MNVIVTSRQYDFKSKPYNNLSHHRLAAAFLATFASPIPFRRFFSYPHSFMAVNFTAVKYWCRNTTCFLTWKKKHQKNVKEASFKYIVFFVTNSGIGQIKQQKRPQLVFFVRYGRFYGFFCLWFGLMYLSWWRCFGNKLYGYWTFSIWNEVARRRAPNK